MTEGRRVLVVDDDPDMLLLCRMQLAHWDFEVVTATTGAEAIAAVADHRPDVVVLDYSLPDMDGPEVIATIQDDLGIDVPVVMLTARTQGEDQELVARLGVVDYVTKPYDENRLIDAVEGVLTPDVPTPCHGCPSS